MTTYRSQTQVYPWTYSISYYDGTSKTYLGPYYSRDPYSVTNERTVGDNYPDWRNRLKRGDDATTYLYGKKYTQVDHFPGHWEVTPGPNWYGTSVHKKTGDLIRFDWIPNDVRMSSLVSSADNCAKIKHAKKLRQVSHQFQGGVFLGELREAIEQIRNPAGALRRGVGDYYQVVKKRLRRSPKRSYVNVASDTWLEYVFGWAPLINDVKDGAVALARLNLDEKLKTKVVTVCTDEDAEEDATVSSDTSVAYSRIFYRKARHYSVTVIYRTALRVDGFKATDYALDLFGVNWSDVPITIWELIPYSFLIDYFTNIGDIIAAASLRSGRFRWSNKTIIQTIDQKLVDVKLDPYFDSFYRNKGVITSSLFVPYQVTRRTRSVVRTALGPGNNFVPDFELQLPGIGQKWLNIGALAGSKL